MFLGVVIMFVRHCSWSEFMSLNHRQDTHMAKIVFAMDLKLNSRKKLSKMLSYVILSSSEPHISHFVPYY